MLRSGCVRHDGAIACPRWIGIALAIVLAAACSSDPAAQSSSDGGSASRNPDGGSASRNPDGGSASRNPPYVPLEATGVPLNRSDLGQQKVGRFTYAGGVELSVPGDARFGGLSDLAVFDDGRLQSITDQGELIEARLVLDARGRLSGVTDLRMMPLTGRDGAPLADKGAADAEGLAVLPNGDRLVSFERQHRIWRYAADGGAAVPAPAPSAAPTLPFNTGMEALAAMPAIGPRAYLVGSETGHVWECDLDRDCRETALGSRVPAGFGLSGLTASPDGDTIVLVSRAFSPEAGVRVVIRLLPRTALTRADVPLLDELTLTPPLVSDNFEGAALVRGPGGALRLYLLSDNNFSAAQHTFLLAFDWAAR